MRTFMSFAAALGVVGLNVSASAQTRGASDAAGPDLSGVYDGARAIVEPNTYPLTDDGQRAHSAYDPDSDDPRQADDCAPESVPSVLWSGTISNMQLVQRDQVIELHYEHGGTLRSIQMHGEAPASDAPHGPLGYSVGRWEDSTLVIETSHLEDGVIFTDRGYPISRDARMTERYWREPGQKNLQLELVIDDPANYTQPLTLRREWIWSPAERVRPWDCVSLGPRDVEPDIDELRELLNSLE